MRQLEYKICTGLQLRVKALERQVEAFRSGDKYLHMAEDYRKLENSSMHKINKLKKELGSAHAEITATRNRWFRAFEDFERDWNRERKRYKCQLTGKDVTISDLKGKLATARSQVTEKNKVIYALKVELEAANERIKKLKAQVNRDYENSSLPSSMSMSHKKISNSREKTGRKPGGQPGHSGHPRRKQKVTDVVYLPAPKEVQENPDLYRKENTISKQLVRLKVLLDVTEYQAEIYRDRETGERLHAPFPAGVVNEVNYDGTVKAFAFLLNNHCNVPIDKCSEFLSDLTNGQLKLSKGMINGLSGAFAAKTEPERKKCFAELLLKPVMHSDATNARYNGINANVYVCASPDGTVMYFARENKGHAGLNGTPVEEYQGILVHDHDVSYYSYGEKHQECLAHVLRYLKDSMENEPDLKWNKGMYDLLQGAIHYRNSLEPKQKVSAGKVKEIEKAYDKMIEKAKQEYEYEPPTWYKDGYNLYKRLAADPDSYLLFLHDTRVPTTNNMAERLLRSYKRKQKQAVSFRSFDSIDALCNSKSTLLMMQQNPDQSLYRQVAEKFN